MLGRGVATLNRMARESHLKKVNEDRKEVQVSQMDNQEKQREPVQGRGGAGVGVVCLRIARTPAQPEE